MPVETRGQAAARCPVGVGVVVPKEEEHSEEPVAVEAAGWVERQACWWEEKEHEMASGGADGRLKFSGKKGDGLTHKQLELMVKGSLEDRFKKLQKDVGNLVDGAEFKKKYCIYMGEFLDNPAKLAHEQEYEEWCKKADPVEALLESLKRHFCDHKEGRAQEWVNFRRELGEELPALLFRLQGLASDLGNDKDDQELVTKFIPSLDRRLAEQTSSQALAATKKPSGAYTLTEAYEAALRAQTVNVRLRIAREMAPRVADVGKPRWGGKPAAAHMASPACSHAAHVATDAGYPKLAAAGPTAAGGSGACHNCRETGHYKNGCSYPRRNSSGVNHQQGPARAGGRGQPRACYVCGDINHLAAQCPKRAVPVAVAATATGEGLGGAASISAEDFRAFQEWKAMAQAAAAPPAEEDEDDG
jgi:hypothetical protein